MPCYDSRNEREYVETEPRKESQAYIDKLTRLLCEANKLLDGMRGDSPERSVELDTWWREHQIVDRKRRGK